MKSMGWGSLGRQIAAGNGQMASVTVDVDIDEFDDVEIICATKERGYRVFVSEEQMAQFHKWDKDKIHKLDVELFQATTAQEDLAEILDCVKGNRRMDAVALIEALMFPKFKTLTECEAKYSKV